MAQPIALAEEGELLAVVAFLATTVDGGREHVDVVVPWVPEFLGPENAAARASQAENAPARLLVAAEGEAGLDTGSGCVSKRITLDLLLGEELACFGPAKVVDVGGSFQEMRGLEKVCDRGIEGEAVDEHALNIGK